MATQNLRIQLRRDSKAAWDNASNVVLFDGEVGLELDTGRSKTGYASKTWSQLDYNAGGITATGKGLVLEDGTNGTTIGKANVDLGPFSTDDLSEGLTNQYFTAERATSSISIELSAATKNGSLSYSDSSGIFTYAPCDAYTEAEVDAVISPLEQRVADIEGLNVGDGTKADLVNGRIPINQIPNLAVVEFLGSVADEAAMLASGADTLGDFVIREDKGTTYVVVALPSTEVTNWRELQAAGAAVLSVNGKSGPTVDLGANDFLDIYSVTEIDTQNGALRAYTDAQVLLAKNEIGITTGALDGRVTALESDKADILDPTFSNDVTINNDLTVGGTVHGDVNGDVVGSISGGTGAFAGTVQAPDFIGNVKESESGAVIVSRGYRFLNGHIRKSTTVGGEPTAIILDAALDSAAAATLYGNVVGNVTGDVTGNVTGNVAGDLTGSVDATDAAHSVKVTTQTLLTDANDADANAQAASMEVVLNYNTTIVEPALQLKAGLAGAAFTGDVTIDTNLTVAGTVTGGALVGNLTKADVTSPSIKDGTASRIATGADLTDKADLVDPVFPQTVTVVGDLGCQGTVTGNVVPSQNLDFNPYTLELAPLATNAAGRTAATCDFVNLRITDDAKPYADAAVAAATGSNLDLTQVTTDTLPAGSTNKYLLDSDKTNYDTAFGWGDHSTAGYADDTQVRADFASADTTIESNANAYTDNAVTNSGNWDTAFGWGDHGAAGYAAASDLSTTDGNVSTNTAAITTLNANSSTAGSVDKKVDDAITANNAAYISIADLKTLVAGAGDYGAFQTAIAAL